MTFNVDNINKMISADAGEFILQCEQKHKDQYDKIISMILSGMPGLRIVCVAGPSSSGKTTFSNILREKLFTKGIKAAVLSLDDYFFNKKDIVPEPDGTVDFESIKCVDSALFRENLQSIIRGIPTPVPRYNFTTGKREDGYRTIQIDAGGLVFVEGIHALNFDVLLGGKIKDIMMGVFISPEDDYEVGGRVLGHVETRLLRRITRDFYHRNSTILRTLDMWKSVRKGEFENIFPYKPNSDFTFNSSLAYEICVLQDDFLKEYETLSDKEKEYVNGIINTDLIKAFGILPDNIVPEDSLLNEFIMHPAKMA